MKRSDIENKYKWDLDFLYHNYDEWNKDLKKVPKYIEKVGSYKGHLLDSASNLLSYYKDSSEAEELIDRLHFYTFLNADVDINDKDSNEYSDKINNIILQYNEAVSYVVPEILKGDYNTILKYIDELDELKSYSFMFEEMFRVKEHILSDREEAIIEGFKASAEYYSKSSQFIRNKEIDFKEIELEDGTFEKLTASSYYKYASSANRDYRRQASINHNNGYHAHINSLASNYIGFIKNYELIAKYHNYTSYFDKKLFEAGIDKKVYEILKKVTIKHKDGYIKYKNLIKNALNIEDFMSYDMNAPILKNNTKEYSILEAKNIILDIFNFYGDEYNKYLNKAFDEKCIDFLPSDEKVTGWYSAYIPCLHPLVFANYNNRILDISSLCHELGHFVNEYMTIDNQPSHYVYQSTFCGEVASLNNEIVFSKLYRDRENDNNIKLELLFNFIKTFASNYYGAFRQAFFEEEAHKIAYDGGALSSDILSDLWEKITIDVMGETLPGFTKEGWAMIPHFYMGGGHYTYTYSTAIVAATNLSYKLLNNEKGIKEKFIKFLKTGSSMSPMDSLKILGIDMTKEETFEIAISMFESAIDEFNKLMNKGSE